MTKKAAKRDWVRAHAGDTTSDAEFLTKFAAAFGIRDEAKAAAELKEILAADKAVEDQFEDSSWARHIALGMVLMAEMRAAGQMSAAAQMWKAISQVKGFEKAKVELEVSGPSPDVVRERIAQLLRDQHVREQAEAAGLEQHVRDQAQAAGVDKWTGPNRSLNPMHRAAESKQSEPSEPSEASNDAGPANIVAEHVASVLCPKK